MRPFLYSVFLFVATVVLIGCEPEDNVPPVFDLFEVEGQEFPDSLIVEAGQQIVAYAEVSDNTNLGQLRLVVHPNNDGHSHNSNWQSPGNAENDWEYLRIVGIEGTVRVEEFVIDLPDYIIGSWDLLVDVVDDAGNLAETQFTGLIIENSNLPVITVDALSPDIINESNVLQGGDTLFVTGQVMDDSGLAEVFFEWQLDEELWSENLDFTQGETVVSFDNFESFAPDTAGVTASFTIRALDITGFERAWSREVVLQD